MLRAAKNGGSNDIKFYGKKVYHDWDRGEITKNDLGLKLMKDIWIKQNIKDPSYYSAVDSMLTDWKLYENGWYISKYDNKHLFYYKTQMGNYGSHRPDTLDCLKK
tara:strand:- start:107 stop:421 length:315 start_codon:yes stop_codon:yes gene_type:complete